MSKCSFFIIVVGFIFSGCATKNQKNNADMIKYEDIEKIELGASKDSLQNLLAFSPEIEYPSKEDNFEHWLFYGKEEAPWQRGTVSFDGNTNFVAVKNFLPFEGELENNLEYLIQKKFAGVHFEKAKLKMCSRHYIPTEAYYVNVANGIAVKHDEYKKYVETIIWFSSDRAKKLLEDIKSCKK